jgi:hypothetical protein
MITPLYGGVVVKECEGCRKMENHFGINWCSVYSNPVAKWRIGECFFNQTEKVKPVRKVRVGQQKTKQQKKGW